MFYMQVVTDYIVQAVRALKRDKSIRAIVTKQGFQDIYVAEMREKMKKTVLQYLTCTARPPCLGLPAVIVNG